MTTKEIFRKLKRWGPKESFWRVLRRVVLFFRFPTLTLSHHFYLRERSRKGYAIKKVNGFKMYLDLENDLGIAKDLYIFGKREHYTTDFVLNSSPIRKGDAVLDIGANIGYYALLWSRLVGTSGLVYALEPVSNNFRILQKNIEINRVKNIETYKLAAGSENKRDFINVAEAGNISSFIDYDNFVFKDKEEVKIVKIDDWLRDKRMPKLVRMDVEGYESEILKGMKRVLERIPYLLIETHPALMSDQQKKEMSSILMKNGFKVERIFYHDFGSFNRKGRARALTRFINEKIYSKSKTENRIKTMNKGTNLGKVFEEGGFNVLFSKT